VSVEFAEHGNETEMIFKQEGFASENSRGSHQHGWDGSFDKLDAVL